MAFPVKQFYQRSFCGPGFVAESRFVSEPGITAFSIYCLSLAVRVLHQLGPKQMKKMLISRACCCLDLQQCLCRLPKVSVRNESWGFVVLLHWQYYLTPAHLCWGILPPWIAQCWDLASL